MLLIFQKKSYFVVNKFIKSLNYLIMKKSKIVFIILLGLFVVLQGCKKKEITDNNVVPEAKLTVADLPELELKDGMLYFDNAEDFFTTVTILPNLTEEELDAWENKLGFISVRTMQKKFNNEFENFDKENITEEDIKTLVDEYKDYFKIIVGEDGEREVAYIIDNPVYPCIANKDLMYRTGNKINKIIENKLYATDYENINDMYKLTQENYFNFNNIEKFIYEQSGYKQSGNCTRFEKGSGDETLEDEYELLDGGCSDHRKVKIIMKTYYVHYQVSGGWETSWYATVRVRAYQKIICIWINYQNPLEFRDVKGRILIDNYNDRYFSITDAIAPSGSYKLDGGGLVYSSINPTGAQVGFTEAEGKATSQGVGNNWAIIEYPSSITPPNCYLCHPGAIP